MTHYADAAHKYLSYHVLTNIPARILQARHSNQTRPERDARLVHDAVLLMFVVSVTCLQLRQIREALICGAANVFKGPLSSLAGITMPEWAADELRRNPASEFWQIHFSGKEAAGPSVNAFLPQSMVQVIEEYLMQHRSLLAGGNDPGTLFLNKRGGPLSARQLTSLVGELTARFASCRMTPAMIRRLFELGRQAEKAHDYYTLSRVVGREDVREFFGE
ncbi:MAG: hypothetical protein ABSD67_20600 [Terracidiphilus sp.]|jgi:hypothetical protein